MYHRAISDIFPASYPNPLDAEDVQRKCASRLSDADRAEDIYYWLSHELCPYLREAYAEGMWALLQQKSADPDDDSLSGLRTYHWEDIESHINHIIRCARAEQLADNIQITEDLAKTNPEVAAVVIPQIQSMEQQLKQLSEQVESLTEEIRKDQPTPKVHWPYYTPKATEEDKRFFEYYLASLIQAHDTSAIKRFLEGKERENLILRPEQIKEEYTILASMGYKRAKKTYLNA